MSINLFRRRSDQALIWLSLGTALALTLISPPVAAHSFGKSYSLPVPVWLYLYGAAAALLVSFLIVGYLVNARSVELNLRERDLSGNRLFRLLLHPGSVGLFRVLSVATLVLTLLTGWLGKNNAYSNLSMTLFWIIFVLGYAYLTALIGNTFARLNPWLVICEWLEVLRPGLFRGRWRYPPGLAYWPALILYMVFIWFELFGRTKPLDLSNLLAGYSLLTLVCAYFFGKAAWFRYGELFAVFLRIIGLMAPLTAREEAGSGRLQARLRQPFVGLSTEKLAQFSLLMFILFMLSSTAFDGIKSTVPYVRIYWVHVAELLKPWLGNDIVVSFPTLKAIYVYWQIAMLALSPFLYLAVYLFFIWLCKLISRSELSVMALAYRFAYSLVPIAVVYHVTHYYSMLLSQGMQVFKLASDPFGLGWDLFGTATSNFAIIPQAGTVWHTQVWMILAGHIVSVYLAHMEALKIFPSNGRAALSQLPMLLLMVALTTAGLWILSLPISGGQ